MLTSVDAYSDTGQVVRWNFTQFSQQWAAFSFLKTDFRVGKKGAAELKKKEKKFCLKSFCRPASLKPDVLWPIIRMRCYVWGDLSQSNGTKIVRGSPLAEAISTEEACRRLCVTSSRCCSDILLSGRTSSRKTFVALVSSAEYFTVSHVRFRFCPHLLFLFSFNVSSWKDWN